MVNAARSSSTYGVASTVLSAQDGTERTKTRPQRQLSGRKKNSDAQIGQIEPVSAAVPKEVTCRTGMGSAVDGFGHGIDIHGASSFPPVLSENCPSPV